MSEDSDTARFFSKVRKSDGCWEWDRWKNKAGYGRFYMNGKNLLAHRAAYLLTRVPVDGLFVLHRCDNPGCVRPDHLFLGNNRDNVLDSSSKNRHWCQKKTHCRRGHPLSGSNLRIGIRRGRKFRSCITCRTEESRRYRAKGAN